MSQKTLIISPRWLGDAVMCTPFLKEWKAARPRSSVDVLCSSALEPLFSSHPSVHHVQVYDRTAGPLAAARRLRKAAYTECAVLPPSFSSAWLAWLARIPRRVGYPTDFRRLLLTESLALDERLHYTRRYLAFLHKEDREITRLDLHFPAADASESGPWFKKHGLDGSAFLAMAPGSRAPARRWPAVHFAQLVDRLPASRWPAVAFLGAAEDRAVVQEITALTRTKRRILDLCGKTTLPVLGAVLRRARALVTNESGLMHAGWAAGTPMVVLAGPSDPRVTSPFGSRIKVLQRREVPCVPCVRNECYRAGPGYMECMKRLEPDEVLEALEETAGS